MRACLYEGCPETVDDSTPWGMAFCPTHHPDNVLARRVKPRKERPLAEFCGRGHRWTPENTYRFKSGSRNCKKCAAIRRKKNRKKAREKRTTPRQTRCKYGHEFTPNNIQLTPTGRRLCKACADERKKAQYCSHGHTLVVRSKLAQTAAGCLECRRELERRQKNERKARERKTA